MSWLSSASNKVSSAVKKNPGKAVGFAAGDPILTAAGALYDPSRGGGGGGSNPGSGAGPDTMYAMGPTFKSALDEGGGLQDQYKINVQGIQNPADVQFQKVRAGQLSTKDLLADPRALDAMRQRALSEGPSPWLNLQEERLGLQEAQARDMATRQALGNRAATESNLAMSGGLSGGARERVGRNAMRDLSRQQQGIAQSGLMGRTDLAIADDAQKMGLLGQTASLDLAGAAHRADLDKFNIDKRLDADKFTSTGLLDAGKFNRTQDLDAAKFNSQLDFNTQQFNKGSAMDWLGKEGDFNMDMYKQKMAAWAADQQANAIKAAAGKPVSGWQRMLDPGSIFDGAKWK